MTLKSEREARLLAVSKRFDAGLSRFDLSLWEEILAPNVIVRAAHHTMFAGEGPQVLVESTY